MSDNRSNDDLWAQLLGAALTEAAKQAGGPVSDPDPAATVPEEAAASPAESAFLSFEKGATLLGTYRIESEPMRGGMGSVWRVRHTGWNTDLAMKRPQPQMFATEAAKRGFADECRNWINLGLHPNIVSCYYIREIGGVPTIFSEWMENGSLKNRIDDESLYAGSAGEVSARLLDIAIQYARGLHYAHESGLIHQDVKPDNLLLTKDWQAKAADFGLANARAQLTVLEGDRTLQDPGRTMNAAAGGYTPAYCSMEQMDGKVLTRRTDIYSWAVSVMEMYIGARPWTNGVVAGMSCRTYFEGGKVPMPDALKELLSKCLAANPDDRPHDFAAVEKELQTIYRDTLGEDYPRPASQAAADTGDSLNNRALTFIDLNMPEKAADCWAQALEKDPDHPAAVYNQALYLWREGKIKYDEVIRRCASLTVSASRQGEADFKERSRAQIDAEKADTDPRASFRCAHRKINNFGLVMQYPQARFSPDGQTIYCVFDAVSARRADTLDETYSNMDGIGDTIVDMLDLTPDGKRLLFHKMRSYHQPRERGARRIVVNLGADCKLWVADAATGDILCNFPCHEKELTALCALPDNAHCVTAGHDFAVYQWDLTTGKRALAYETDAEYRRHSPVHKLIVSRDGRLLCGVYRAYPYMMLMLWDAASGRLLRTAKADFELGDACFSPDGKRIYTCGDAGFGVWDAETLTCSAHPTEAELIKIWIDPAGKRLLTGDKQQNITVWDAAELRLLRVLQGHEGEIRSLDALPDLSRIVTTDWRGNALIWDTVSPVRRAPWELSRISECHDVMDRQQAKKKLRERIEAALQGDGIDQALSLLLEAESQYEKHDFFDLRRRIARRCVRGRLTGRYEIASYQSAAWQVNRDRNDKGSAAFHPLEHTVAIRYAFSPLIELRDDLGRSVGGIRLPDREEFDYCNILSSLCWSRDGKLLAVGGENDVLLLDADGQRAVKKLEGFHAYFSTLAFSPDGKWLSACATDGDLAVWEIGSGCLTVQASERSRYYDGLFFLQNGSQLVVLEPEALHLFALPGGREIRTVRLEEVCHRGILSCDGKTLFLFTDEREKKLLCLSTETWKTLDQFTLIPDSQDYAHGPDCVSADDTLLAIAEKKTVALWSLPERKKLETFTLLADVDQLAFSPDGSVLLAVSADKVYSWALQRELSFPGWRDSDPQAEPIIAQFRAVYPHAEEEQRQMLLRELENKGFGYLRLPDAPPNDAGKTVTEPVDPGKTAMEPFDPGITVTDSLDMGQTVPEHTETQRPEPPAEQPGSAFEKGALLLDTYRIDSDEIRGGMGSVWRVRHTGWNVDLALKRPQPQMFADETDKQNFINECRRWIELGLHPNIVSCYYVREIEDVPTIFSEWMENGDLEHHIQKGTLYVGTEQEQQARLLDIAIQYARGLRYAHDNGLIHRDVKPANLLLTPDWQAKAADFGLAEARAQLTVREQPDDDGATRADGKNVYTPAYCSMEQMDGKALTRATDIYSWAVSVMEMYLGSRPWQNGVVAGMSCRSYFEGGKVTMPGALKELLAKCLETNPDDRPHDFAAIEKALQTIYQDSLGEPYGRPAPEAAADTADSLNNRALSYLDLGMPEKAEACWNEAADKEPDAVNVIYNRGLYRLLSDPKTNGDSYALQNGMGNLFSDLLQRNNGNPTARSGELLANLYVADYYGRYADEYLRQAMTGSPASSPERQAFRERLERINSAWMMLPTESDECGFIAFDVAEDRCAVAWEHYGKGARLAVYDIPSRREIAGVTMDVRLFAEHRMKRVIICHEAIYLCGRDGYSFAAFDPDTLERLPQYDRCDFTKREDNGEWPYMPLADGLRRLRPDANIAWELEHGRDVAWNAGTGLWARPKPDKRPGGVNIKPDSSARRCRLEATPPAMGLSAYAYAVSTDSRHRWLLVYYRPYYLKDKRYFAIYDLSVFGQVPGYAICRAASYAEAFGKQNKMKRLLDEAETCRKGNKIKEALELLDQAYALEPDHPSEEWSRVNNAVGGSPGCCRAALRASRATGVFTARQLPASPRHTGGYRLENLVPGGSMMLMMALASGGMPYGFFNVDPCSEHLVFIRDGDTYAGKLENGAVAARIPADMLSPGAIGVRETQFVHGVERKYAVYACASGMLSVWDGDRTPAAFRSAVRFGQAVPPGKEEDPDYMNSLPPLNPTDPDAGWSLVPYLVSLNRPTLATVALVQSRVLNRLGPDKTDGLSAVSVIDLRSMRLLHTLFVHNKRSLPDYGCSHAIGMDMLMDISPEGDLFLWHSPSSHPFLWLIRETGKFEEIRLGSTGAELLRMDGTAYISMASMGPEGDKYKEVTLDWQYDREQMSVPYLKKMSLPYVVGLGEDAYRAALLQLPESQPEKKPRDDMDDLLAGLQSQARDRMNAGKTQPPQKPRDDMDDLLADLERQARDRLNKKPKK